MNDTFVPSHRTRSLCCSLNRWPGRASSATFETLPTINRKYFFMDVPCIESVFPQKGTQQNSLFGNSLLRHSHHFNYWTQPLNMRRRVCYLNCHEAGLCCYLVIRTLQNYYISYRCYNSICDFFTDSMHIGYWRERQKERNHWEDQDVGGWTILKWILER
jgi:hypothetical protein